MRLDVVDFVVGSPRFLNGHDFIWMIVDRLTKAAHFLPVKATFSVAKLAQLNIGRMVSLHGIPISIISDRGPQFIFHSWRAFQKALGTIAWHSIHRLTVNSKGLSDPWKAC